MELHIGNYKVRLWIVLLIIVVFWILCMHVFCSCSHYGILETMQNIATAMPSVTDKKKEPAPHDPKVIDTSNKTKSVTEGFSGYNSSAFSDEYAGAQDSGVLQPPSTWAMPSLTYSPGTTPGKGVESILSRPKQPIPLPPGELDVFATTEFKPECCPNAFSSSTGCACMTVDQYNYLINRGGNNVPYSEY